MFTFDVRLDADGIDKLLQAISYFVHLVVDELCKYEISSEEKENAHYTREEYYNLRIKKREVNS